MERITDDMRNALDNLADDFKLLLVSPRHWYATSHWIEDKDIHPNTLNALIRHGLVQKKTIEVYELTPAGHYALQSGRLPKETVAQTNDPEEGAGNSD